VLLRNQWLAGAAFMIIWTLSKLPGNDHPWLAAPFYAIVYAILVIIMLRFGLFALAITTSLIDGINQALITTDIFAWYGVSSLAVLLIAGGMALVGFRMALGGRSLLNEKVLES